jgi:hypothetical protein
MTAGLADNFDPYREWLGLALDRPPSHYELLSLSPGESDERQIALAAEQAASKVRSFRPGPHARAWSRLLDEIQAAKECLSDPARRAEYDAELRRGQSSWPVASVVTEAQPPSALGAVSSELYPPGMMRPASAPPSPAPQPAVVVRPRSDLDPPAPISATPVSPAPISATPVYVTSSETVEAAEASWAAGPSPIYDAAMPTAQPAAHAAALDPMAPVSVEALLPPGAEVMTSPVAAESPFAVSSAPTATQLANQQARQARTLLALAGLGLIAILGGAAATYAVMTRRSASDSRAIAEKPSGPEPAPLQPPKPKPPDIAAAPIEPSVVPTPIAPPSEARPTPTPLTPPTPAPSTPAPSTTNEPPPMITRAEVQALIKALEAAKTAIGEQNFKAADAQLAKAESLARLPKHKGAVARLKEADGYVKQFHQALAAAVQGMQAGESFKVGNSTQVAFVEGGPDKVVVRIAGMNRTYHFNDMPPGLAMKFAERKLADSDPASRVIKGAYLLTHRRGDSDSQEKAKSLLAEAQAQGADVQHLLLLVTDNYADLMKDVPAGT